MIAKSLQQHLVAHAGLSALVGTRVFPVRLPQKDIEYPAISYTQITGGRIHTIGGPCDLAFPTFQFDIFARYYTDILSVALQLRLAIDGYRRADGQMGTSDLTTVDGILSEDFEQDDWDEVTQLYQRIVHFKVWHRETTP